jgi:hypothetical protein
LWLTNEHKIVFEKIWQLKYRRREGKRMVWSIPSEAYPCLEGSEIIVALYYALQGHGTFPVSCGPNDADEISEGWCFNIPRIRKALIRKNFFTQPG